jgi:hypothetical protein
MTDTKQSPAGPVVDVSKPNPPPARVTDAWPGTGAKIERPYTGATDKFPLPGKAND